ncbi:MAG: hypothetical protein WHS88_01240 [Anaerohalosphaeraceae bacterium]
MKKRWFWGLSILLFGLGIWALAAETETPSSSEGQRPARPIRLREPIQPRPRVSMSDPNAPIPRPTIRERVQADAAPLAAIEARHQELIAELTAVLKLAQEENALKTAEAVQKLIDKHNAEYKRNLELIQQRRAEIQRRAEQRIRERESSRSAEGTSNQTQQTAEPSQQQPAPGN